MPTSTVLDPALTDRRKNSLPDVKESALPGRNISIAGCEGRIEARTLSKDMSGPATRLVKLSHGWGSGVSGAFTADVEIFVIQGRLTVGGRTVDQYDYAAVRSGEMISGIRALDPTLALLMTSAPVRYDTSVGGMLSQPFIGANRDSKWQPVGPLPGRFVRHLADGLHGPVWLAGARQWSNQGGPWHSHEGAEEVFVLDGEFTIAEHDPSLDGHRSNEPADPAVYIRPPGTYTFRRPGVLHAGPGSSSSELALAFHRLHGSKGQTWTDHHQE
ncbi:MAG: DUF4437 domain-containing protein [Acidimicrobiia bacterium]|nr:DUF4437 domain-containing protein [bacterium]MXX63699.1 DUF4437 domain-containing protein [Acidimicrobiia bacterium]MCY3580786.1 DUF4437 domain-containing protein [bacterium]MCY3652056.1 DUF4437 domain-containing protein [bacterium]MDE0642869.1 DUF4437 domain-containing protein [bacterium]